PSRDSTSNFPSLISTRDVPEQQWSIRKRAFYPVMQQVARGILGSELPQEIVDHILDFAEVGFTWEDALQFRLELMKERCVDSPNFATCSTSTGRCTSMKTTRNG